MAKGKQAAALFEVIHGVNRDKSGETRLVTPKWWFKSKKRDVSVVARDASAAPMPRATVTPRAPVPAAPPPRVVFDSPAHVGATVTAPPPVSRERVSEPVEHKSGLKFVLPSSQTIAFGLMLAAVLGVGFVVGQRFRNEASPVIAEHTSAELIAGDAHPDVMEIGDGNPISPTSTVVTEDASPTPDPTVANLAPPVQKPTPTWNDVRQPSTSVVEDRQRVIGYNYVIVQSYPDDKSALEAVKQLADNGIPATVVKGPPGWAAATWFSVVGTRGFDKIRNSPEFDRYVKSIERVSAKFAGNSKFKQFSPRAYKWKTAEPIAGAR